jgi:hypothetical protein
MLVVGALAPVLLINGRVMKPSLAARKMLKPSNTIVARRMNTVIIMAK